VLQIVDYIQREHFTEVIISTPGPVGLVALLAAKLLGLRTSGIYHTDFPQVRRHPHRRPLARDAHLGVHALVLLPARHHLRELRAITAAAGSSAASRSEKLKIFPRGLDTSFSTPRAARKASGRNSARGNGEPVLLYVGRISKEKDLDVLAAAYRKVRSATPQHGSSSSATGLISRNSGRPLPEAVFHRVPQRRRPGQGVRLGGYLRLPKHHGHLWQRGPRGDGIRLPRLSRTRAGRGNWSGTASPGYVTRSLDVEGFTVAIERSSPIRPPARRWRKKPRPPVQDRDWSEAFAHSGQPL